MIEIAEVSSFLDYSFGAGGGVSHTKHLSYHQAPSPIRPLVCFKSLGPFGLFAEGMKAVVCSC